ncbi:MAG: glycoside hydrolase family 2 TIM barrel-domain containing protein [Armatimonadota bacterium]
MLLFAALALALQQSAGPIKVSIVKTPAGYQLMRGTQKYFVKGVGGTIKMKQLKEAGGNSMRTWGTEKVAEELDEAHKRGISIMVGIWLGHKNYFDYKNPKQVAEQYESVKKDILRLKDKPAVLVWGLGNEMEIGNDIPETWKAIEDLAKLAKQLDPNHPTSTVIADFDTKKIANIRKYCPSIDVLGINSYGGLATVPRRLKEAGWTKPYIVTEFGPIGPWESKKTAWGAAYEPTSTEKAKKYASDYQKSVRSQQGWCLGSYAFLWGDKQEETPTWFGMYLPTGERTEAVDVMIRAWSGHLPHNCAPEIDSFELDIKGQEVSPGSTFSANVSYHDPDSKSLKVRWEVRDETPERKHDGQGEKTGAIVQGGWQVAEGGKLEAKVPGLPGRYRLYVYINDDKGSAACGNWPFKVK